MTELDIFEKKVIEAMKALGAISEDKLRDVDKIAKQAKLPKGKVASTLQKLINKKIVKRVTRQKVAGYYLLKSDI